LVVVIAIVGLLAGLATTVWKRVIWRMQVGGAMNEFRDAIVSARSDAVTRRRNSGIVFDPAGKRYLRFVDSTGNDIHDGRYSTGERILKPWTALPKQLIVYSVSAAISPEPTPRPCQGRSSTVSSAQVGTFSITFRPSGQSWSTFQAKLGVATFPSDTFRVDILPATGLVTMAH